MVLALWFGLAVAPVSLAVVGPFIVAVHKQAPSTDSDGQSIPKQPLDPEKYVAGGTSDQEGAEGCVIGRTADEVEVEMCVGRGVSDQEDMELCVASSTSDLETTYQVDVPSPG